MKVRSGAALFAPLCPATAFAQEDPQTSATEAGDVVVYGCALQQVGAATSGSQGTVGYEDFANRPLSRVGELMENVPGVELLNTLDSHDADITYYYASRLPDEPAGGVSTTIICTRSSRANYASRSAAASEPLFSGPDHARHPPYAGCHLRAGRVCWSA